MFWSSDYRNDRNSSRATSHYLLCCSVSVKSRPKYLLTLFYSRVSADLGAGGLTPLQLSGNLVVGWSASDSHMPVGLWSPLGLQCPYRKRFLADFLYPALRPDLLDIYSTKTASERIILPFDKASMIGDLME